MGNACQTSGYGADPHRHEHALSIAEQIAKCPQSPAYEYSPGDTFHCSHLSVQAPLRYKKYIRRNRRE